MGPPHSLRQFLAAVASQARSATRITVQGLERKRTHQVALAVTVSLAFGALVAHSAFRVRALQDQWTDGDVVVVASTTIRAGEPVTPANTRSVRLPLAVSATDALRAVTPGMRARITLSSRTAITGSMVEVESSRITVPVGWRGVALPADLVAPAVTPGDRVDIVATGSIVASDALILSVARDRRITVAVPIESAATVATAARLGEVSLILSS